MPITLPQEARKQSLASIRRYVAENFDQDIGDLKAIGLLDYFLKEIGPTVYNQAIAHAHPGSRTSSQNSAMNGPLKPWPLPAARCAATRRSAGSTEKTHSAVKQGCGAAAAESRVRQPRSGERVQPTAQAVGEKCEMSTP